MAGSTIICEDYKPLGIAEQAGALEDHVQIWLASVSSFLPFLSNITEILSDDEVSKSKQFHQLKDSQSYIVRHGILRLLLAKHTQLRPDDIKFTTGKNKKPAMAGSLIAIHFNTSHSGDMVIIALAHTEVGIDIEQIREGFDYNDILNYSFSATEVSFIKNSIDPREDFYRLWTRKEALLKANSKGLDDDLYQIPSLDGTHQISAKLFGSDNSWSVKSFMPRGSYAASAAHATGLKIGLIECTPEHLFPQLSS